MSLYIDCLLANFDAQGNDIDRRLYFEITGRQLNYGEFDIDDSSDGEWALTANQLDPFDLLLQYPGDDGNGPGSGTE